jgi:hypothetical protein
LALGPPLPLPLVTTTEGSKNFAPLTLADARTNFLGYPLLKRLTALAKEKVTFSLPRAP